MARYHYTVSGPGSFPIDMLRFDCAWPFQQADVSALERAGTGTQHAAVRLESDHAPTLERWASFHWPVSDVEVIQ